MKVLRKIIRLSLSATVLFLLLELFLRIGSGLLISPRHLTHGLPLFIDLRQGIFQYSPAGTRPLSGHTPRQTKLVPTSHGIVKAQINSEGFRGEDFTIEKDPNTIRIATLGASSTFGFTSADEETYPVLLEQVLNSKCHGVRKFEVYNFGAPYLSSADIVRIFQVYVRKYEPDVVTFYEGANDCAGEPYWWFEPYWNRFKAVFLIGEYLNAALRDSMKRCTLADSGKGQKERETRFLAHLNSILESCREDGIQFIPATQQTKSYLIAVDKLQGVTYEEELDQVLEKLNETTITRFECQFVRHAGLMKRLREWSALENLDLVDVIDRLNSNRQFLTTWVHMGKSGNEIVAESFADKIAQYWCPSAPENQPEESAR